MRMQSGIAYAMAMGMTTNPAKPLTARIVVHDNRVVSVTVIDGTVSATARTQTPVSSFRDALAMLARMARETRRELVWSVTLN